MSPSSALVVGCTGFLLLIACGGGEGASSFQEPRTESSPTTPAAGTPAGGEANDGQGEQPADEPTNGPPSVLTASPACASHGSRVVLKLGLTRDHRVPNCFKVDEARVVFAPNKHAKVAFIGPTDAGYCAIDVEVPEGAETGKVTVQIGRDAFESEAIFDVPCP